ncbi:uncharacterized protein LOC125672232 isoform X2 [Ostrea edulis]|nr:uncharacterized protein LOC125672232 isoform X2 [Ostrea edulis]
MEYQRRYQQLAFVIILMSSCVVGLTESRTSTEENVYPLSLLEGKSWWNKRSIGNPVKRIGNKLSEDDCDCQTSLQIHRCYATNCAPRFLHCIRNTSNEHHYSVCQGGHNLCLSKCYRLEKDRF